MSVVAVSPEDFEPWPTRSAHPADQAQARLFEEILRRELDDVEILAARVRTARADHSDIRLRHDLQRFNARINELRGLLTALENRFSP
ncbi:hypothetical protein [Mycolicibacterium sphagni]|uniref:Uncharacterized protein n=1 Tax=Mycolicibacterium sphagni TaxID=1786 RepID=A0ABX2JST2_9MYCO|nr:hypothetical protein [Mycolicibacterium sphagni]NTY58550.1 hypothetical protein [Mycolicibacterium sphagni]